LLNSKFVKAIQVRDPDTNLWVEFEIRKLENGLLVGLDGSYLESLGDEEHPNNPYEDGKFIVPCDEKKE